MAGACNKKQLTFLNELLLHVQNTLYGEIFTRVEKTGFSKTRSRQWPFFKRLQSSTHCIILGK